MIEVGEYVRNKEGLIFRVDKEKKNIQINEFMNMRGERDIVKHSKNIIDLIEEGDYVNGKRVIYVASIENKDDEEELCVFVEETQDCIEAKDIKSIVTKEQFKNIEYRLE